MSELGEKWVKSSDFLVCSGNMLFVPAIIEVLLLTVRGKYLGVAERSKHLYGWMDCVEF